MFKLFLIATFFLSIKAQASYTDLSLGTQLRSYPSLGGEVYLHTGHNIVFWGEAQKRNPLYGLIRPAIDFSSSGVINSVTPKIEFYPISFLGVSYGKQFTHSNYDEFTFYNCEKARCKGSLDKGFAEFKMALAYDKWVSMGLVRVSQNSYSKGNNMPVAEFRYATLVNQEKESEYFSQYILGFYGKNALYALAMEYVRFDESNQYYKSQFVLYNPKYKNSNMILGLGTFESSHVAMGVIALFRFHYDLIPSKKLF